MQERIKELQEVVDTIPNLQQSLKRAGLEAEQVPILQEQVKQCVKQIKSLDLRLSNQDREKKRLFHDLEVKAEKQLEDALNQIEQKLREQVLKRLQNLRLPSDDLKEQFTQACAEAFPEGCSLNDFFEILQQLLDYIQRNYDQQVATMDQKLETKIKENQALATKLNDVKLSACHLQSSSDSVQSELDAARRQLAEKDNQVESLRSHSSVLEKSLAEKAQLYEEERVITKKLQVASEEQKSTLVATGRQLSELQIEVQTLEAYAREMPQAHAKECNEIKAKLLSIEKNYEAGQAEWQKSLLDLESQRHTVKNLQASLDNAQNEVVVLQSTSTDKDTEITRLKDVYSKTIDEKEQGNIQQSINHRNH